MARKTTTVIPSAHRLMQSLRDIGYDLPDAVADLIDNSLAAGATEVRIDYEFEGTDTWMRIADNGSGMKAEALDEALRYGTRRDYGELELGKFGLGLKTASMSQCKILTVASKTDGRSRAAIRCWDLNHIQKTDAWELLRLSTREAHPEVTVPLKKGHGTVVFWEQLDRILGYTLPAGQAAQTGFKRMCQELEEHLAMVFHRFLSGEAKRNKPLTIYLNDHLIEPWDPFARKEPKTQTMRTHRITFEHEDVKSYIRIQPFILPHESQFSSNQAHKLAAGPRKWNAQQGFYIYRNDRMLQSGGWNRLRAPDEHVKLARITVEFPPSADAAFKINVSKMGISFPAEVREQLTEIVKEATRRADEAYRKKEQKTAKSPTPQPTSRYSGGEKPVSSLGGFGGASTGGSSGGFTGGFGTDEARKSGGITEGRTGEQAGTTKPQTGSVLVTSVVRILQQELSGDPVTLKRVLSALAGVSDDFVVPAIMIHSRTGETESA